MAQIPEPTPTPEPARTQPLFDTLQKAVALVGGITGVFIGLAWLAGRMYYVAFFEAIGIPRGQLEYSLWHYVEVGWLPIALVVFIGSQAVYLVSTFVPTLSVQAIKRMTIAGVGASLLGAIFVNWNVLLSVLFFALGNSIVATYTIYQNARVLKAFRPPYSLLITMPFTQFSVVIGLLFGALSAVLASLLLILGASYGGGYLNGRIFAASRRPLVILTSQTPLAISATDVISSTIQIESTNIFTYGGLYLLASNEEQYWLYSCVADDGKPLRVYVVPNDDLDTVEIVPLTRTPPTCTTSRADVAPLPSTTALPSASAVPSP